MPSTGRLLSSCHGLFSPALVGIIALVSRVNGILTGVRELSLPPVLQKETTQSVVSFCNNSLTLRFPSHDTERYSMYAALRSCIAVARIA